MKLVVTLMLTCLCNLALAETLTILNWEDYLSEKTISTWEKRSGHKINQIYFDNDEDRDNVLVNHKDQIIDLAVIDEVASRIFGQKGALYPLSSYTNTPNLSGVDSTFQKSCGKHSTPYLWGTLGIAYRKDKILIPPASWDFILKPDDDLKGHIGLMDDFTDTLAPALIRMNFSINTDSRSELKKAFNQIKKILPDILTFEYSITFLDADKQRDELYVALAYSGDQYSLNDKTGQEVWDFTTVNEGTIFWVDCLALMSDSPRKSIALDFLNYLYSVTIAAENSELVQVASPIKAARALQSKEFLADKAVYPPDHVMAKSQQYQVLSPENILLRNRITSSLIKMHESK